MSPEIKKRKVELPDGSFFFVQNPGMKETQEADWQYSKTFNAAISNGIPPRAAMLQTLRAQGIWTDEDESTEQALRIGLNNALMTLQEIADEGKDEKTFDEIRDEVRACRESLFAHISRLNSFLQHTAESKADDARIFYLTSVCSVDKDGKRIWKDFKTFQNEADADKINRAVMQFMFLINGLDDSMETILPENTIEFSKPEEPSDEAELDGTSRDSE